MALTALSIHASLPACNFATGLSFSCLSTFLPRPAPPVIASSERGLYATFATRHRDSSPTPIALFLNLNHGEMVRFNWGLNYCHNTMYSPHLSVWYNDLTYETRCQVFSLIIIPLYIKGLHPLWPSVNSCALYAI